MNAGVLGVIPVLQLGSPGSCGLCSEPCAAGVLVHLGLLHLVHLGLSGLVEYPAEVVRLLAERLVVWTRGSTYAVGFGFGGV